VLAVRRFDLIFGFLALALLAPTWAAADSTLRSLLLDLNSTPLYVTKPSEGETSVRIMSDSGRFSLLSSDRHHRTFSSQHWVRRDPKISAASVFDLLVTHRPDGSGLWAHIGSKSPAGMPGVLAAVSPYARSFVIEYDPDEVISEVSLDTYRGTTIYCGRIPNTHHRSSCSLVHVVLHGRETIRFYALIVANRPNQRDALLGEFFSLLASIELHEP
jgi:hypothetical protein